MINVFSYLRASSFALLLLLFASLNAYAELVPIPALQHRVTDLTQTLSQEQQSALEQRIATFEQEKGSQIAVLIVPTDRKSVV